MPRPARGGYGGGSKGKDGEKLKFGGTKELEEAANSVQEDSSEEDVMKELYPMLEGEEFITAAPITEYEMRLVEKHRKIMKDHRNGPFWTGNQADWDAQKGKKKGANFDPFNDMPTYANKKRKRQWQPSNFKKIKYVHAATLPKELKDMAWDYVPTQPTKKVKTAALPKESAADKLAQEAEESHELEANDKAAEESDKESEVAHSDDDGADKEDDEDEEDEDDSERENKDSEFESEDDDDYNAEKYFDDGDEDGYDAEEDYRDGEL